MHQVRVLFAVLILGALAKSPLFAQLPQQDCFGALPVCQTVSTQTNSYNGVGTVNELYNTNSCLFNGENNSVWYIFTVSTAGNLEFTITPVSANDDYDFALFNITGKSCDSILNQSLQEVRCNYALTIGTPTGISSTGTGVSGGPNDPAFLTSLPVLVGETYVLVVDNFTPNGRGYTLDFSNGTASIADTVEPFLDSVAPRTCDTTLYVDVFFSEPISCSSLLANGTQFVASGPQPLLIIGASGLNCGGPQLFTTGVRLQLAAPILTAGTYWFKPTMGTGGVNILDNCGRSVTNDSASVLAPAIVLPNFTYDIAASCLVDTIHFINTSNPSTTNGNPVWLWDFGDLSSTSTFQDPPHVFPDTVQYNITLTATTIDGCRYSWDSIIPVERSYRAAFEYAPTEICPGVPVQFIDNSPGSADTWLWDFGDNNISGDPNPVNIYASSGTYTVTLTISENSAAGFCSATTSQDILVLPDVDAAFTISNPTICEGTPTVLIDQTVGMPSSWFWDFGTGDTSVSTNPTYTYDSIGAFTITLTVSNACNTDVATQNIQVYPIPVFNLGNDTTICFDRAVTLTAFPGANTIWSTGQTGDSILVIGAPIEVRATSNVNGCTYDDAIYIEELQEGCIIVPVPTAFTPNRDGFNDLWRLVNPQRLLSIEVWIYNRWGQLVFYDDQLEFAWDGNHKGEEAPIGVYSYILKGFGESSRGKEPVFYRGNITLVR